MPRRRSDAFEERNRLLGDSAPLGIFTVDIQGRITGINMKMLEMLSWTTVDDPTSLNLFDCPAISASGIVAEIQRCITQKKTGHRRTSLYHPSGDLHPFALLPQSHTRKRAWCR
jgi:PAS domain-containing protein